MKKTFDWTNPYKKVDDVTKRTLTGNKRFVIVEFDDKDKPIHKCLAFLVSDIKNAKCPGYPACAVEYFNSFEEGKRKIEALYERVGYTPEYPVDKYVSKSN